MMRYLPLGTMSAEASQAVYHAVADTMTAQDPVTLITVSPDRPYVCLGYHQVGSRELDREYCEEVGLPVGRRMLGGGAVYLDHDQIFWHLVLPRTGLMVDRLYNTYLKAQVTAYQRLGIAAAHRPVNDIVVGSRKIGGTGAGTLGQATVVVGSIMMDFDMGAMARVLNVPSEKFRDKMVASLEQYMTTVKRELGNMAPSREQATGILVEEFSRVVGEPVRPGSLTAVERSRLDYYARHLFDPSFVYQHEGFLSPGVKIRDGVRLFEGIHKAPGGLIRVIVRERDGRFDDVLIAGDFFVDPLDALEAVASSLVGLPLSPAAYLPRLGETMARFQFPGVTADDIRQAIDASLQAAPVSYG